MKKTILLILLVGSLFTLSNQAFSQARAGGGLAYGTEVSAAGLSLNSEFLLNSDLAIAPGAIIYFEDFWEINGNVHFMLNGSSAVVPYAIGGLNLISANGNSELGLNAGIGANFDMGWKPRLSSEIKYVLGDFDQLVLMMGLKWPLSIN